MFTPVPKDQKLTIDDAIDELLRDMVGVRGDSPQYAGMVARLEALYSLKKIESNRRVSPDTLAIVLGNLAGIVLILGYERINVVSSRALNFVMKLR